MVYILLTLHNPEHFINPYVICNNGCGILFFCPYTVDVCSKWTPFHSQNCLNMLTCWIYIYCCTRMGMGVGTI